MATSLHPMSLSTDHQLRKSFPAFSFLFDLPIARALLPWTQLFWPVANSASTNCYDGIVFCLSRPPRPTTIASFYFYVRREKSRESFDDQTHAPLHLATGNCLSSVVSLYILASIWQYQVDFINCQDSSSRRTMRWINFPPPPTFVWGRLATTESVFYFSLSAVNVSHSTIDTHDDRRSVKMPTAIRVEIYERIALFVYI